MTRVPPTRRQVDQLIKDGFDRQTLPEPRPDSKIAPPAATKPVNEDSRNGTTIRPTPVPPSPDIHYSKPQKGTDGVLFLVIAIIVFLIILLAVSTTSHGEQFPAPPAAASDSLPYMGYSPVDEFVFIFKASDTANPILTNILQKVERLDRRIDAVARSNENTTRRNQNQASSIDRRMASVGNATTAAVVEGARAISNCLIETHLRTSSSLDRICDAQSATITLLAGTRNLVILVLAVLILCMAVVLHRCYPQAFRHLVRPFRAGYTNPASPISTQLAHMHDYRNDLFLPAEALVRLLRSSHDNSDLQIKASVCPIGWKVGFRSDKGPFRTNNQDHVVMFGSGDRCVCGVADGVGSLPSGADASCCAVTVASSHLAYYLGRDPAESELPDILHHAMLSASHALTGKALRDNMHGMRTTLALVVATPQNYYAESIGDGKFVVVRKDGKVEVLVEPQRVPGAPLNHLAASLGPLIDGNPQSSSLPVLPNDLLIGGSDGLWNIVDDEFPQVLLGAVRQFNGDLQFIAETVVADLVGEKDPLRLPCRDNLTIALAYRDDMPGANHA